MAVIMCNGRTATPEDLAALALVNYGHFTTLQVRAGAALGLGLHLERLRVATSALLGMQLEPERVRADLRAALAAAQCEDATLRATLFASDAGPAASARPAQVDLLVSVGPPGQPGTTGLRLRSVQFVRAAPQYKHVGIFPSVHERQSALAAGYDDALFVDDRGHAVEGTFWNLGLWDGTRVIWPQGPALRGTRERLLQAGLERLGIPQQTRLVRLQDIGPELAAFSCNSRGQQRVSAIDDRVLADAPELLARLERALATQAWEKV